MYIFKILFSFLAVSLYLFSFAQYKVGYKERGQASYYSAKLVGKKTASGEVYLADKLTAAHRKLPFNTIIRITNRNNGKWIYAKINDRGPFTHKRIIDVSSAIADSLDMKTKGGTAVEIEIMHLPAVPKTNTAVPSKKQAGKVTDSKTQSKPKSVTSKPKIKPSKWYKPTGFYSLWGAKRNPTGFGLQIGSFTVEEDAKQAGKAALELGLEVIYIHASNADNQTVYRVIAESYKTRAAAETALTKIKRRGFPKAFIKKY